MRSSRCRCSAAAIVWAVPRFSSHRVSPRELYFATLEAIGGMPWPLGPWHDPTVRPPWTNGAVSMFRRGRAASDVREVVEIDLVGHCLCKISIPPSKSCSFSSRSSFARSNQSAHRSYAFSEPLHLQKHLVPFPSKHNVRVQLFKYKQQNILILLVCDEDVERTELRFDSVFGGPVP